MVRPYWLLKSGKSFRLQVWMTRADEASLKRLAGLCGFGNMHEMLRFLARDLKSQKSFVKLIRKNKPDNMLRI